MHVEMVTDLVGEADVSDAASAVGAAAETSLTRNITPMVRPTTINHRDIKASSSFMIPSTAMDSRQLYSGFA
jgi:hypothetical protein